MTRRQRNYTANGSTNGSTAPPNETAKESEYPLEIAPIEKLKIDHSSNRGGYARPVSEDRLRKLRKSWKLAKTGTIHVNRRSDGSLWLIDGQHRVEVAKEKGVADVILVPVPKGREVLVALLHETDDHSEEADLYLGYADALPQQALSVFMAKLSRGDREATAIRTTVQSVGLKLGLDYKAAHSDDGTVIAIGRLERIYATAGSAGLREVLFLAKEAWGLDHRAYQQAMLEALFQFWAAYRNAFDRERLVGRLREVGVEGLTSKAYAIRSHGEWPGTVDSLVMAIWRAYHEAGVDARRVLRAHQLPTWTGKRARPLGDENNVKPFAPGTRAARVAKATEERNQLSLVGG